ncbi:cobalamin biosynthesis protein CobW [Mycolicibacterium moriokaense]|uniref:Cobalamin synthesis protein n=1 Tax=Mycolicibacterium moriokaense TaxID=39691 RepID=A0AAD1M5F3_9MYCO|nr:GTP-binding protein [Mycolicibacterium moriokaense]MCV7040210.1 GTP-binding protein [Mycolicibacterium moriokaense]ORB20072.1 cobalamin biosynthesis protein CobW [Mycolicibacterium moriokaense]BBX00225.1 putative cobalamin synthesis protein [Mycolicibacterium moriokaense]
MEDIPVVALTGYLGAGKTSLLNHVLRTPRARVGVIVNDFGELNVDAGLVTGQVDEPASIAGGCVCCLPDNGGLDDALTKLADPRLDLDAIIVETSGLADPVAVAQLIRFSGAEGVRPGGIVDVIDATTHFDVVDRDTTPPARYAAASLVVVNKLDGLPEADRQPLLERVEQRVRVRNPVAPVVGTVGGRIDPALLYDLPGSSDEPGQLSFRELLFDAPAHTDDDHVHADAVTVTSSGCIDPGKLIDLLENPPPGVYRLKGTIAVRYRSAVRTYVANLVGTAIHIATVAATATPNSLVAIGMDLDTERVRARLGDTLEPHDGNARGEAIRRLQRYRRLSL